MSLSDYDTVIGLETHVQLATRTKMFCGCRNTFGEAPNSVTCPVCLGLPGALPVANAEAFRLAIRAGLALGCEIATTTRFDRKNYFYPDLPKGYQISQLDHPINGHGLVELSLTGTGQVTIDRAHLEEDAGKCVHEGADDTTLVDLNRCGIPLLEIVTGCDITSADMAHAYLTQLRLTIRQLGVSDCDMEKGSLRCDVNISLKPAGAEKLGTKIELKNLNSFKMVRRAILYEQERQSSILDAGGTIDAEETRLWDDDADETRLMRRKEDSADYRYYPDPDLPPHDIAPSVVEEQRALIGELPGPRKQRFMNEMGLSEMEALPLVQQQGSAVFFEETAKLCNSPQKAANWVLGELFAALKSDDRSLEDLALTPTRLAELIALTEDGTLNIAAAREVFSELLNADGNPRDIAEQRGLLQLSDEGELRATVMAAMEANPKAVEDIRSGNKKAAGALVGAVMKATGGRANPGIVNRLISEIMG